MTTPLQRRTLIEDLDARQNDVLDQLDQLNTRVLALLEECTAKPESDDAVPDSTPAAVPSAVTS